MPIVANIGGMEALQAAAKAAVERHGGVRKAARALEIEYTYMSRLAAGKRKSAGVDVLRKLGLTYRIVALKSLPEDIHS